VQATALGTAEARQHTAMQGMTDRRWARHRIKFSLAQERPEPHAIRRRAFTQLPPGMIIRDALPDNRRRAMMVADA
jgi:hypothetical protein